MTHAPTHRRGVAAATAVTMLALVGVTIAAMGSLFVAEARRTRDAAAEAQLRQLLVAGAAAVDADPPLPGETKIELPPELVAEGALLVVRPAPSADANTLLVDIEAHVGEREMGQTLRYARRDGRWELVAATPGP